MNARVCLNPTTDKLFLVVEPMSQDDKSLLHLFAKQTTKSGSKVWVNPSYLLDSGVQVLGILFDTADKDD